MQLRLIKTFQTIVRTGSFYRAAEELQYSQPTVTVQIKKLESELGVQLFERGKTIKLTKAGQLVYERADSLLKEYSDFNSMLTDYIQGETGIVLVGASEPSASRRVPQILASILRKKPKLQIKVSVGTNQELMQMVLDDRVDFALCHQPEPHLFAMCRPTELGAELEFHPLCFERFALLLPADHKLASKKQILLKDLKNERLLITPASCPFQLKLKSTVSRKMGSLFDNGIEVASITAIKYYVQAGLGITFIPVVDAYPLAPGTVVKSVADLELGPEIGILAKRGAFVQGTVNAQIFEQFQQLLPDLDESLLL